MSVAALAKVAEAALDSAADISEEVLDRDSDAAPSVLWPEQRWIGQLLSAEYTAPAGESHSESAPSRLCYALQGLCVAIGLDIIFTLKYNAEMAGMARAMKGRAVAVDAGADDV